MKIHNFLKSFELLGSAGFLGQLVHYNILLLNKASILVICTVSKYISGQPIHLLFNVKYRDVYGTENMYVARLIYGRQISIKLTTRLCSTVPSQLYFFISSAQLSLKSLYSYKPSLQCSFLCDR